VQKHLVATTIEEKPGNEKGADMEEILIKLNAPIDELTGLVGAVSDDVTRQILDQKIGSLMSILVDIEYEYGKWASKNNGGV